VIFGQNNFKQAYQPFWSFKGNGITDAGLAYNNTVISGNISSLSNNPALMGKKKKIITAISFNSNLFQQHAEMGNSYYKKAATDSKQIKSGLDNFGVIYPVSVYKGNFVLGFSFSNRVKYNYHSEASGTGVTLYNDDTYTQYKLQETVNQKGNLNSYNFSGAIQFRENIYLGTSLHIYNGKRYFEYNAKDEDEYNYFSYQINKLEENLNSDYFGYNMSFGILYESKYFECGFNFSTPLNLNVKEDWNSDTTDIYDDGNKFNASSSFNNYKYNTIYPNKFSAGFAIKNDGLKVSLDVTFNDWDKIEYNIDRNQYSNQNEIESDVQNNINSNLSGNIDYGIGVQYNMDRSELNLGYRIMGKPKKDLEKKYDKLNLFGLGLNYNLTEKFTLGLGYQYSHGKNKGSPYFLTRKEEHYNNHRVVMTAELNITKQEQKDY